MVLHHATAPDLRRLRGGQIEHRAAFVVAGRDEQLRAAENWVSRIHAVARVPSVLPQNRAVARIDALVGAARAQHDLLLAVHRDQMRRRIARCVRLRLPHELAGRLFKRRAVLADVQDQIRAMNEHGTRETPLRNLRARFFEEILLPHHLPRRRLEANQITPAADMPCFVALDHRTGRGAAFVVFVAQLGLVAVLPHFLPGRRIKAKHRVLAIRMPRGENAAIRHRERRKADPNLRLPKRLHLCPGQFFRRNARLVRSTPHRPVSGLDGGSKGGEKKKGVFHEAHEVPGKP